MPALTSFSTIKDLLYDIPEVRIVRDLAKEYNIPFLISGGALRDLLLNGKISNDIDFFLECSYPVGNELKQKVFEALNSTNLKRAPQYKIDLIIVDNVGYFLYQFDSTINAIAYNPETEEIINPLNGLSHLEKREMHLCTPSFFSNSATATIRVFYQACKLGFNIPESTLNLLKELAPLFTIASPFRVSKTLHYLMLFFSYSQIQPYFQQLYKTTLLNHFFPEIALNEKARLYPQHAMNLAEYNIQLIFQSHTLIESLPANCQEILLARPKVKIENTFTKNVKEDITPYNLLAVIRLSCLFHLSSRGFLQLDPNLPYLYKSKAFEEASVKNLLENAGSRFSYVTHMGETMLKCIPIVYHSTQLYQLLLNSEEPQTTLKARKIEIDKSSHTFEILILTWIHLSVHKDHHLTNTPTELITEAMHAVQQEIEIMTQIKTLST